MLRHLPSILCASALAACAATEDSVDPHADHVLVYGQPFASAGALGDFAFSAPEVWRWSDEGGRTALELTGPADYQPPHRSPRAIALLEEHLFGDFVLDVDVQQTGRQYGHRDLCLFFGFESPSRFYYVHLASAPDPHAHNVFVVDEAARTALAPVGESGIDWGAPDAEAPWHHVRLERRVADGTIRVYFDDMETPVLEAVDARFPWGQVGVGSFDDSGRFADLRVRAPEVRSPEREASPFPSSPTSSE